LSLNPLFKELRAEGKESAIARNRAWAYFFVTAPFPMAAKATRPSSPKSASKGASANLFAFFGTDEAKVKEAALALAEKIRPPDDEFALEVVSGASDNSEHAGRIIASTIEAILTMPFFGGAKVVWLQGANFFGDSQTGKSESTLAAVESLIEQLEQGLPPDVTFILSATEVDKRRTFYKRIGKIAKVEAHDKADTSKIGWEREVVPEVLRRAKEKGLRFAPGAIERFVLSVGADTRLIENELEKLSLFCGERIVTEDDIDLLTPASHVGIIFAIGDAIADRQIGKALDLIDQQYRKGESAIGILLASIVPRFRTMLHANDLVQRHRITVGRNYAHFLDAVSRLPAEAVAHLPRTKEGKLSVYPHFLAAEAARRFTFAELQGALEACLEANLRLVSSSLDPQLVLNQLVVRILSPAAGKNS
jgi:DNA polymerase-3 subunit delta